MLNTTINKTENTTFAVTRVVEKTITPDKVTEMYDKVRKEVEKEFVRAYVFEGNQLNGVVAEMRLDFNSAYRKVHTRFTLNGKEYIDTTLQLINGDFTESVAWEMIKKHYVDVVSNLLIRDTCRIYLNK